LLRIAINSNKPAGWSHKLRQKFRMPPATEGEIGNDATIQWFQALHDLVGQNWNVALWFEFLGHGIHAQSADGSFRGRGMMLMAGG
jgi:hypothetical protein